MVCAVVFGAVKEETMGAGMGWRSVAGNILFLNSHGLRCITAHILLFLNSHGLKRITAHVILGRGPRLTQGTGDTWVSRVGRAGLLPWRGFTCSCPSCQEVIDLIGDFDRGFGQLR